MLDEKSLFRAKIVTLFGDFNKNDSDNKNFYEAYWTKILKVGSEYKRKKDK